MREGKAAPETWAGVPRERLLEAGGKRAVQAAAGQGSMGVRDAPATGPRWGGGRQATGALFRNGKARGTECKWKSNLISKQHSFL